MVLTTKEKQDKFVSKMKFNRYVRMTDWVHEDDKKTVRDYIKRLRESRGKLEKEEDDIEF